MRYSVDFEIPIVWQIVATSICLSARTCAAPDRPAWPSASSGSRETSVGALLDQGPLELGERGEDMEDQLAPGLGGVDCIGEGAKLDATRFQVTDGLVQVLE